MRMFIAAAVATVVVLGLSAGAHADNSQQSKMTSCNADAKTKALTGDDRKAFMKTCLSAGSSAPAGKTLTPQQQKMKSCNADAKTKALTGDDRKAFMKTCLSGAAS
jgi:hypothetical protein